MASYETKRIFAQNLVRLLEANHISQIEFANKIGVAASSVSNWCNGDKMPRMDKIEWMAQFFNVPVTQLLEQDAQPEIDMSEVDIAFYGDYKELSDDDQKTIRDMVRVMRERRSQKED